MLKAGGSVPEISAILKALSAPRLIFEIARRAEFQDTACPLVDGSALAYLLSNVVYTGWNECLESSMAFNA